MNKAIFIDKDGTLIKDVPFNVNPELIEFEEYAFESLYRLQKKGYLIIIVSNQPGVAYGYFTEEKLEGVREKIKNELESKKVSLNGFYYCPHSEKDNCVCRKPKPGLILKAAKDFKVDLKKSWMVGDILNDVEAGTHSDCRTILIDNGNETEWIWSTSRQPLFMAKHLKEATDIIMLNSF